MFKFSIPKTAKPATEGLFQGDNHNDKDPVFQEVVAAFKDKLGIDLTHMCFVESKVPRNHDGDAKTNQADIIKYTGSWTKHNAIYINPQMEDAIKFYGLEGKATPEQFKKQAIAHELAHEIYEYPLDDCLVASMLKKAEDMRFDTAYLHHIDDDDPKEELFCEYMAYRLTGIWFKVPYV